MQNVFLIFIGSGLGATARYLLSLQLQSSGEGKTMPWGILTCNLLGCLLIGIVFGLLKSHHPNWISPLVVTGFLGGFTTFSSFALDTQKLFQSGNMSLAISYILTSALGGLALCYLGYFLISK